MKHRTRILLAACAGIAVIVALVAGIVLAGGSGEASPTTTTTTPPSTTTVPPAAPLTCEPVSDPEVLERPAVVVKIDNSPKARGRQAGLASADVVYVERVEGGATRIAAVFHSTDALAGPVRSARTTDVDLVANLRTPLFSFSGANNGVMSIVRQADLVDVGYDARTSAYQEHGSGVLRLFVDTEDLYEFAPADAQAPPELFTCSGGATQQQPATETTRGVRVDYGGQVRTGVTYELDAESGRWARSQDGSPHVDADGDRIAPDNVVVQFVSYRSSGFVDVSGASSPEAVLVGEGEAWVFTGGRMVRGHWSRPSAADATTFTDAAGTRVALSPGKTWIELAPVGNASVLEPEQAASPEDVANPGA